MKNKGTYHAIKVDDLKCIGCTHCMRICPTEAIRLKDGKAVINEMRCVDCGNCLRACPVDAFYVEHDDLSGIGQYKYRVVLFPSVFVGQFPEVYSENNIYAALLKLGFTHIYEVEQPVSWLMEAIRNSEEIVAEGPLISSFCPAIVRLIRSKYPALAGNISQRKAPHDLAAIFAVENLKKQGAQPHEIGLFYVTPCSAKMAAVHQPVAEAESMITGIISMTDLYNHLMKVISSSDNQDSSEYRKYLSSEGILWSLPRGETSWYGKRSIAIDGIHNVVKFLERLENDEVPKLDFLELRSCKQGCAGGILLTGNRFLTAERLQKRAARYPHSTSIDPADGEKEQIIARLCTKEVEANPVFILDDNRIKAIEKLNKINAIVCQLPGIDCGGCGAPNCHALAEDIVQGQARMTDCIFLLQEYIRKGKIKPERAGKMMERKWGKNRFDADCNKKGGRNEGF
ncbi:MAG TPA: [Fe-Fe] hydrogenase large subunit C-terminal domain-containing protein [Mariniphaga sp.]|nr:[Fe-Fe] hydrogenase large subunit C-terminal domain-containing protein [Mariniphaga sp.]